MKKILLGALVLAVAICAAFVFLKKASAPRPRAADLVPAETIFFAQFPDLRRTAERWPQTALAQIWAEPEMQAFVAKPREKMPQMKLWQERMEQIAQVNPGEAFFAVTSIDGPQPKLIAGFSFSGKKADVAALLAEPHADMKRAWPAGKSDITSYKGTDVETFTHKDFTMAEGFHGDWYFVANDIDLMHSTLDAAARETSPNSLGAQEIFKKGISPLPAAGDVLLFAQVGTLADRLISLMAASGQAADAKQIEEIRKIKAIAWEAKIEGSQWRDTIFVLSPGAKSEAVMARSATALTSPETVLYYATQVPATMELPQSSLALGAFFPGLTAMDAALTTRGLKWSDFSKAFGPELGTVIDWQVDAAQPSALFALDVRDAAKAKGFADAFTGGLAGATPWGRKEEGGVTIYQGASAGGLLAITPTMALTDRFLVLGLNSGTVAEGLKRLTAGKAVIVQNGGYQNASKLVSPPNAGFAYLDLKAVFERSYGTLRPFVAMSLAFNPEAGRYIDASKLPGTETISRHLGPTIYSQSTTPEGTLIESVGPLTFPQVLLGSLGGSLAAAYPMIENALSGGLKLDPNLFQMKPPAPATPAKSKPKLPAPTPDPAPQTPGAPGNPVNPGQ